MIIYVAVEAKPAPDREPCVGVGKSEAGARQSFQVQWDFGPGEYEAEQPVIEVYSTDLFD